MTFGLHILILLPIVICGLVEIWRSRNSIWRERQETFERIKRGRQAF